MNVAFDVIVVVGREGWGKGVSNLEIVKFVDQTQEGIFQAFIFIFFETNFSSFFVETISLLIAKQDMVLCKYRLA